MQSRFKYLLFSLLLVTLLISTGSSANSAGNNANNHAMTNNAIEKDQQGFAGHWYAILKAPAGELPFELKLKKTGDHYTGELFDGHHHVKLENFKLADNKLTFGIDDARVRFELTRSGNDLIGNWHRAGKSANSDLPFTATHTAPAKSADKQIETSAAKYVGEWHCVTKNEAGKETPIMLIIRVKGQKIEGTGIDPTGDFGQLCGDLIGDRLVLSRFDGQSLSLVVAKLNGEELLAEVSTSPRAKFAINGARKGATLPDPGSVAKVKSSLNFNFADIQGKSVAFPGDQFKNKVVIVNIMGTWCHNCHDETPFLIELYNKYHAKGLEIVSLCFEAQTTEADDKQAISNYQRSRKIPYTLLYAGRLEDEGPAKRVVGLENFGGYPTNIFVGRDGQITATHTGFWGPATGEKYHALKREFEETVVKLLEAK